MDLFALRLTPRVKIRIYSSPTLTESLGNCLNMPWLVAFQPLIQNGLSPTTAVDKQLQFPTDQLGGQQQDSRLHPSSSLALPLLHDSVLDLPGFRGRRAGLGPITPITDKKVSRTSSSQARVTSDRPLHQTEGWDQIVSHFASLFKDSLQLILIW